MFERITLEQELAQVKAQRKELIATLGKLRKKAVDVGKVAEVMANYVDGACLISEEPCTGCKQVADIVDRLADYFATLDDKFDREEFLRRCGV